MSKVRLLIAMVVLVGCADRTVLHERSVLIAKDDCARLGGVFHWGPSSFPGSAYWVRCDPPGGHR